MEHYIGRRAMRRTSSRVTRSGIVTCLFFLIETETLENRLGTTTALVVVSISRFKADRGSCFYGTAGCVEVEQSLTRATNIPRKAYRQLHGLASQDVELFKVLRFVHNGGLYRLRNCRIDALQQFCKPLLRGVLPDGLSREHCFFTLSEREEIW